MSFHFTFKPVEKIQRQLIHKWVAQEHIKEWLHGEGLRNTLEDLDKFFERLSVHHHWIAYDSDIPFGYLLTSEIQKNNFEDDLAQWCQEDGEAITLDLFISNLDYLGKGLAVPMIQEFLISQFSNITEVLIDPEVTNKRAVHVYEKVGFKIIGQFIASWHPVPHYKMRLSMRDLIKQM